MYKKANIGGGRMPAPSREPVFTRPASRPVGQTPGSIPALANSRGVENINPPTQPGWDPGNSPNRQPGDGSNPAMQMGLLQALRGPSGNDTISDPANPNIGMMPKELGGPSGPATPSTSSSYPALYRGDLPPGSHPYGTNGGGMGPTGDPRMDSGPFTPDRSGGIPAGTPAPGSLNPAMDITPTGQHPVAPAPSQFQQDMAHTGQWRGGARFGNQSPSPVPNAPPAAILGKYMNQLGINTAPPHAVDPGTWPGNGSGENAANTYNPLMPSLVHQAPGTLQNIHSIITAPPGVGMQNMPSPPLTTGMPNRNPGYNPGGGAGGGMTNRLQVQSAV